MRSVASRRETVNHRFRILIADGCQAEERSQACSPAVGGGPVKNASGVVELNSDWRAAVVPAGEIVEDAVIRATVDIRDAEHDAQIVRTAVAGDPINNPVVGDRKVHRISAVIGAVKGVHDLLGPHTALLLKEKNRAAV